MEEGNNSVEVRAGRATLEPLWVPFRGATSAISGGQSATAGSQRLLPCLPASALDLSYPDLHTQEGLLWKGSSGRIDFGFVIYGRLQV